MKKSLLALAVAALAASSVASAATVYDKDGVSVDMYGRVQSVYYSNFAAKQGNANDSSVNTSGRLGFNFRSQLTQGVAAIANMEWDVADAEGNDDFGGRYLWVGLDMGNWGTVKFGRFEDAVKYVIGATDIFDDWGCNGQVGNDDKRNGSFGYTWNGYGFTVNVTAQGAENGQQVDGAFYTAQVADYSDDVLVNGKETLNVEYAFAGSVGYTSPVVAFGPISIKAGYGYTAFQNDQKYASTYNYKKMDQYAVSLSWGSLASGPYVAAMYTERNFDVDNTAYKGEVGPKDDYSVSGVEAVVGYAFANGITARTGWEYMNIDQTEKDGADVNAYTVPVYVNYQVNPNFQVWAEARFDAGTDDDSNNSKKNFADVSNGVYNLAEDVFSVGVRYTF